MKKIFLLGFALLASTMFAAAGSDIVVIDKGSAINYPLKNGEIIECYAKRIDGSINEFIEYNDYFKMQNGKLYSDTMNKIYKPKKSNPWKKVDGAKLVDGKKTLQLYDPLWEGSIRHHIRIIKIDTKTGDYYMKGTQDNWMWYRNAVAKGSCRVITE